MQPNEYQTTNIIPFKTKYPLMPATDGLNLNAVQLRTLADLLEERGMNEQAGDIREAAYFIGKVAGELESDKA